MNDIFKKFKDQYNQNLSEIDADATFEPSALTADAERPGEKQAQAAPTSAAKTSDSAASEGQKKPKKSEKKGWFFGRRKKSETPKEPNKITQTFSDLKKTLEEDQQDLSPDADPDKRSKAINRRIDVAALAGGAVLAAFTLITGLNFWWVLGAFVLIFTASVVYMRLKGNGSAVLKFISYKRIFALFIILSLLTSPGSAHAQGNMTFGLGQLTYDTFASGCFLCFVFSNIIEVLEYVQVLIFDAFSQVFVKLIGFSPAIWLLFQAAKLLLPFGVEGRSTAGLMGEIFKRLSVGLIVILILLDGPKFGSTFRDNDVVVDKGFLLENVVDPILMSGINLGNHAMSLVAKSHLVKDKISIICEPKTMYEVGEIASSMECYIFAAQRTFGLGIAVGVGYMFQLSEALLRTNLFNQAREALSKDTGRAWQPGELDYAADAYDNSGTIWGFRNILNLGLHEWAVWSSGSGEASGVDALESISNDTQKTAAELYNSGGLASLASQIVGGFLSLFFGASIVLFYAGILLRFLRLVIGLIGRVFYLSAISPLLLAAFVFPVFRSASTAGLRGVFNAAIQFWMQSIAVFLGMAIFSASANIVYGRAIRAVSKGGADVSASDYITDPAILYKNLLAILSEGGVMHASEVIFGGFLMLFSAYMIHVLLIISEELASEITGGGLGARVSKFTRQAGERAATDTIATTKKVALLPIKLGKKIF